LTPKGKLPAHLPIHDKNKKLINNHLAFISGIFLIASNPGLQPLKICF